MYLYLGMFSADEVDTDDVIEFTLACRASSVEDSLPRFCDFINDLFRNDEIFDGADEIYLDDIIEIREIPEVGLLVDVAIGPKRDGLITRGIDTVHVTSFRWSGSDKEAEGGESVSRTPFLVLKP